MVSSSLLEGVFNVACDRVRSTHTFVIGVRIRIVINVMGAPVMMFQVTCHLFEFVFNWSLFFGRIWKVSIQTFPHVLTTAVD